MGNTAQPLETATDHAQQLNSSLVIIIECLCCFSHAICIENMCLGLQYLQESTQSENPGKPVFFMFLPLSMTDINITLFTRSQSTFVLQGRKFSILGSKSFQELIVTVSKGKESWKINSSLIKIVIVIITPVLHWDVKSRDMMYKPCFSQKSLMYQKKNFCGLFFLNWPKIVMFFTLSRQAKFWRIWVLKAFLLSYLQIRSNFTYNSNMFRKCNSIGVFGREEE